jgi:hypothetical protein
MLRALVAILVATLSPAALSSSAIAETNGQREAIRLLHLAAVNPDALAGMPRQPPSGKAELIACLTDIEQVFTHQSGRAGELAAEYCRRMPRCASNRAFHEMIKEAQGVSIASRWARWSQSDPAAIRSDPWYRWSELQRRLVEQNKPLVAASFGMTPDELGSFVDDLLTSYYRHVVLSLCPRL